MALYPCYPSDRAYTWGSPVVPTNARGAYRPLWQAMDHVGQPRVYPAAWMQCAGRIIKHDCWFYSDLKLALEYLNGGSPIAPIYWADDIGQYNYGTRWDAYVGAGGLYTFGFFWLPNPNIAANWEVVGVEFTGAKRLINCRTGTLYTVASNPYRSQLVVTQGLIFRGNCVWGVPWFNAI